ncbi:MAG: hypothetical protein LLG01_14020, partial [Planctomycetaceae bacterium]|nr:hypothetical protein [Planctomycetaceae bacterium]
MKTLPFTFAILLLSATGGFAASFVDDFSTTGNPSSGWEYGGFATSFNPASTATWIWNKKASQYTTSDYGGGTGWRYAPEDLATYEGIFLLNNGLGVMCASASVGGYATAP